MVTQAESQFRGRISSILQVFIEAAVTEICELIELEVVALRSELSCRSERSSSRGKLTLQPTEDNISSGNERGFAVPDHTETLSHNTVGHGLAERKIYSHQGTPNSSQPCAVWNPQSANEDAKNDAVEGCTGGDAVSVKKETLEDCDRQERDTSGVGIGLHDPNEAMGAGLEWTNAEASTNPASAKCGSKPEQACGGSAPHDVSAWDSAAAAEKHYAQSSQLAQDVDLQLEEEEGEQGSTYLANWTNQTSPTKGHSQAHHSMQYMHEESPDSMEGLGLNLPPGGGGGDFHSVRVDLSGSHLGMSVHHSMSLEERFICPMCGKVLRSDRALRAHMKDHTTLHICNHCGKSFARLTNLRVHQNIHMGLKPYSCKFCAKKFSDPSNYNRHKHRCPKAVHT